MNLTQSNKEWLFWILQLVGWFSISAMIFTFPFGFSTKYIVYSFFTGGTMGILATSLFRYYLKNNIDIEVFGSASIKKLFVSFMGCSGFYYFLANIFEKIYESIWTRTPTELEWIAENVSFFSILINIMFTVLGWTIIYFVIKFILEANKNHLKQLTLNATLREAQLNTLKGQVNPHFMFNSLNNIRGLMLEDVEKSRNMITKLSEMLEYALEKNTVDSISLSEELEMVENYIALSKIQMEDRLTFEKSIARETLSISIPPMIIQLLIENAAKHGIADLKNGGVISLRTEKVADVLLITVSNTGKLRIAKDSTQLGLENIRQRIRLLYGDKASFAIEEVEDEVMATIKIPLI
ncbi:histidine kinase [Aggregatimonas sangjinii]|uniref:Histidine kinase n=1 Tax=Aggregatimonas sangjinii TaxID=2583587 RepID=A0A5B7SR58_9FLAO|nr:histidine kinase [Aggregatimonas sangjinii]QCX01106.1 histidine kinase [Aggregatimonas sangjinii]